METIIYDFDWQKLRKMSQQYILVHSDDDPYVPLSHGKFLAEKLSGKLVVLKGQKHFSTSTAGLKYKKFPFLLELVDRK